MVGVREYEAVLLFKRTQEMSIYQPRSRRFYHLDYQNQYRLSRSTFTIRAALSATVVINVGILRNFSNAIRAPTPFSTRPTAYEINMRGPLH